MITVFSSYETKYLRKKWGYDHMYDGETIKIEDFGQESEHDLTATDKEFSEAVLWGTDSTTETIFNQLKRGNIGLDPKFQRRNVWKDEQKSKLIESIMLGIPIPPIILAERKDKKIHIL